MTKKLSLIVAMTTDLVIGNKGKLPWHISEDLKLFKEITTNNTVLMGRETYFSIPKKYRPLPSRNNIVLTSQDLEEEGVDFCPRFVEALNLAREYKNEIFVIGGRSLYQQTLPLATHMYISKIKKRYVGDTFFPMFNADDWEQIHEKEFKEFDFQIYTRK
ncbi:dihydrofolate reductase [Candidatus Pacearchaeota archaeon]|nr:dihydrofolate reductase [Candidatus Pacearchaeota archaeon]